MAIVNTNTAPILQEGTNITLTQTGQTITITATDTTNAPGGSNTEVQFNDSGVFGGDAGLTYNKTTNVVSLESIDFATTPAATDAERRLKWDNDEGSLVLTLKGGNVSIPLGAEVVSLVYNAEATTLTKGTVVYAFGSSGQRVSVKKAVNTSDATSAQTFGVIAESIAAGAEGFCMVQGMVRGIDTSAYVQGDPIYLSATAGQFTKTKPVAPNHLVYIGFVVKINASSGEIFVRPQNGYEMDEIHDYLEGSVQNNDVISYESSSGLYKPKSIPTLLGYTPANQATTITINGTSYDLSANRTWSVGTVTSVGITAGTGINVSGSPIIGSGSITVTNSAPDQTVVLTAGSGISISGTYPSFTITNTGSSGITGSGTSNYITKFTGTSAIGNSNLQTDASGNLGLGVTPSAWGSAFKSIQIGTGLSALSDSNGRATYLSNNWYYDTGDKYMAAYQATLYYQYLGAHTWLTAGTGSAGAALTWTQAMTLDSSGRLGIGTTSPTATLQIGTGIGTFDGLSIGAAANRDIRIGQSSTNNLVIAWKYNATAASAYGLIETFGGSNNLILQGTGGNVGIGTTSPSDRLHVETSSEYQITYVRTGAGKRWAWGIDTAGTYINNRTDSILPLYITNSGSVGINNTSPTLKLHVNGGAIFGPNSNSGVYISGTNENTINSGYGTDDDTRDLWLNYRGYQDGFTRFRDVRVGNGKGSVIAFFQGSTSRLGVGTENPSAKLVVEDGVANQTGAPTYRGSMIISNGGGSTSTSGGLEFHAASSGSGYGWRVSTPDLGSGNIPVSYQSRTNNASWTERLRLNTSGQLQLNNYTSTTSFTGTVAGLLAFDSSGNVLTKAVSGSDTYETGTWTPTLEVQTPNTNFTSVSYDAIRAGYYTKIGNIVYIHGVMRTDSVLKGSAPTGAPVVIGGLPFTNDKDVNVSITYTNAVDAAQVVSGNYDGQSTYFVLYRVTSTTAHIAVTVADIRTGTDSNLYRFFGFYKV